MRLLITLFHYVLLSSILISYIIQKVVPYRYINIKNQSKIRNEIKKSLKIP